MSDVTVPELGYYYIAEDTFSSRREVFSIREYDQILDWFKDTHPTHRRVYRVACREVTALF